MANSVYDFLPMTRDAIENSAEKENVSATQYIRWYFPNEYKQWQDAEDAPTKTPTVLDMPFITKAGQEELIAEQSASPFYETKSQEGERLGQIAAAKKATADDADKRLAGMEESSGQSIYTFLGNKSISYQDPETGETMSAVGESQIKALAKEKGLSALQIIEQAAPSVVKDFTNAVIKAQVQGKAAAKEYVGGRSTGVQMQTSAPPPRNGISNVNQFYRSQENQMAPPDRQPNLSWFNPNNPYISTVPNNLGNQDWYGYYANPFAAGGQLGPLQGGGGPYNWFPPEMDGVSSEVLPNPNISSGAGDPTLRSVQDLQNYQVGAAGAYASNQPFWWSGAGPVGGDPGMATGDPSFQDWGMAGEERDIARAASSLPMQRGPEVTQGLEALWELDLKPYTQYRRHMGNLYNPTPAERLVSGRNLGVGYYPAYGSFLLGRGAAGTGGREETEQAGFQRFLEGGTGRTTPLSTTRARYAGLAQSLADPAGTGAYGIYGGFMPGQEGFGGRMIGAAEAALGTGGSARDRLNEIYGNLAEMYSPTEAASKFADFVGSAFR